MKVPGTVYQPSNRSYPRPLIDVTFDAFDELARVDKNGCITRHRQRVHISSALKHEDVELVPHHDVDGRWDVAWGGIALGYLDEHRICARKKRGEPKVSGMSLGKVSGISALAHAPEGGCRRRSLKRAGQVPFVLQSCLGEP